MAEPVLPFIDLIAQRRRLGAELDRAILDVVDGARFVNGPEVAELEAALAGRGGVAEVVTCGSGTDALTLTLRALGVSPGDRVIVPAFTFVAPAEAVVLCGAAPLCVDVRDADANLDPEQVDRALADDPSIVGVIAVDLYGHPADHDALEAVTAARGVWLVVDAAQSFGAALGGRPTLGRGRAATTSFFPAKPLGAYGDGGAVFTDDAALAAAVRSAREHGAGADRYEHVRIGTTSRLDTLQAAVLLAKLTVFDEECDARQVVADRYGRLLGDLVRVPDVLPAARPVWAQYTIRVDDRDAVRAALERVGVPTAVHYPRTIPSQPAYVSAPVAAGGVAVAERLAGEVLSLPMHPYLTPADQDRVVAAVRAAVAGVHP